MARSEQLVDELIGAVLDGTAVDWTAAESAADSLARPLVRRLGLVASVARVYRDGLPAERADSTTHPRESTAALDRWGHLRVLGRVGAGAFGEVFRAWDTRLDREVALKLLTAQPARDGESSFIQEGRLLAKVRHPNVVTIYGAEQIGDRVGLWMEFVRGQTLEEQLQQGTGFRAADLIDIGVELCHAVSAVHAAGLLHRDIKAQNVTRAEDGRVVLMDFGAGSELADNSTSDVAGTPLYSAPEVLAGSAPTVQSDIYSLGVLLYHLATKSYPVRGRTVREVREAHERGERIGIRSVRSDLRPTLARVIERACDPRPERRYANADAFARALSDVRRHPAIAALRYGLAACAAVLIVVLLASEARARLLGGHRSLGSRLASLIAGPPSPLERPVIAVLPFKSLGSDASSNLLVDSVTTGLIRQLSFIDGLQVRSQASSFMFRDKPRDLAEVGKRLSANLVVEGDARISNDTLLINAALLSVADGRTLWSLTVDRQLRSEADVVGLVEELTRTIVNRLRLKLGPTQRRYDTDIATFRTYLKARALRDARGADARSAIALFDAVIRADPSYAPAKAALAAVYGDLAMNYPTAGGYAIPPDEAVRMMEPLTRSALEIDPMLAEAHASIGFLHAMALRWTEAEASFRHAIELEPNLTSVYGDFIWSTLVPWGRLNESLKLLEAALEADPLSLDLRRVLSYVQLSIGLYQEARDNARRVLDVDPTFPFVDNYLRWALLFNGERAAALKQLEEFSVGRPGVRGYIHAINGRRAEAEAIAAQFTHLPQRQAEIYGLLGDKDRALEALERLAAVNALKAAAYLNHPEIGLRGDPRVQAFRRKLRIPQ
ncbi:MAG TPA: protein kinase [Vicinamibacterales bacterium]|jgi:serine/threonine-protein kinase|nr:protein kinase [Vicinamibacterales bacterium]